MANCPNSWQSKKQLTVSRSSTESEYHSLSDAAQEGVWLSRILTKLQPDTSKLIPINHVSSQLSHNLHTLQIQSDNQGAIKLAKNPIFHVRTKYIEIHHHFVRERILEGEIGLRYINTHAQKADILTKPLGRIKFETHIDSLRLQSLTTLLHP